MTSSKIMQTTYRKTQGVAVFICNNLDDVVLCNPSKYFRYCIQGHTNLSTFPALIFQGGLFYEASQSVPYKPTYDSTDILPPDCPPNEKSIQVIFVTL